MEVFVARQPIFTKKLKIYGYELLFREDMTNVFPGTEGNEATSKLISDSFFNIGAESITGGKRAFVNFTQELLVRKIPMMFPKEKVTIEVLEDVQPIDEVIAACREMSSAGYQIALDDFLYRPDLDPLLALSKLIKIDCAATSRNQREEIFSLLEAYPVKFVAEKIETYEDFQEAAEMNFHYFQGFFFSKPQVFRSKDISPQKMNMLRIMAETNKEDFEFRKIEEMISRDVSLSYKLLSYINSPYFRRLCEISSIKQAVVLLGEQGIRQFISLIALTNLASEKPNELIRSSIVRARFCELLGKSCNHHLDTSGLFTLGLFSLIDAILDDTMDRIMERLPLSRTIKSALIEGAGDLATFLNLVSAYEMGRWLRVSEAAGKLGVPEEVIPGHYIDAVGWADSYSEI